MVGDSATLALPTSCGRIESSALLYELQIFEVAVCIDGGPFPMTSSTPDLSVYPAGVARLENEHLVVVSIEGLTDELKDCIRASLVGICRGPAAADGVPGWNYESTVRELHTRLKNKSRNIQVGMIGELLTHVLSFAVFPHLSQTSVYFNKEERAHKKGFDLTFMEDTLSQIWYCEVKSGELGKLSVADKSAQLLKAAAADLIGKLTITERASLWDTAINDAMLVLRDADLSRVKELLSGDSTAASEGNDWERHAILTAGVFDTGRATADEIRAAIGNLARFDDRYASEIWLVIQKNTYTAVIEFLEAEATK